ncbi:acyl carrier protein [Hyalangium versicolor]|uniref:acyl carrier protein n=1 Tax=Hyalangium versicolor TaxID=2861190 RepID=UPI001CCC3F20|nr:hypothetical protein [Hyalangium versicolor]
MHRLEPAPRRGPALDRDELVAWMQDAIREIRLDLSREQVEEEASLVHDLGFDSLALEGLMARVKARFPSVDLTPWYMRAAQHGQDSLATLVDFLLQMDARNPPREGDET